ncbi:MAG: hypothetical protein MK200_07515 [Nitrosopumilus sp.]|nr:hypothetical protein [Nitrosopumilus sp.]
MKYLEDGPNCRNLVNFAGCPKSSKSTSIPELSALSEKSNPVIISHNLNPNAAIFYPRENSTLNPNSCSFISLTEYTRKTQFEEIQFCEQFSLEKENSKSRNKNKNLDLCVFANTLGEVTGNQNTPQCHLMPIDNSPGIQDLSTPGFSNLSELDNADCTMKYFSPCVLNSLTPVVSNASNITNTNMRESIANNSFGSASTSINDIFSNSSNESVQHTADNAIAILNDIRKKYINNVLIGHININAIANKFDALKVIIENRLDVLVLVETKLDDSFPEQQFIIDGYKKPYRLDRNSNGGGFDLC